KHGIFGYTEPGPDYFAALDSWCLQRYGWHIAQDEVIVTPGVVFALAMAVKAFTEPGDAVIIQQPVYYPFSFVVTENGRTLVNAQLAYDGQRYSMDFAELEHLIEESNAKLIILCNPHNPVGRAWTAAELEQLGEVCLRHGVVVVSDEIHMDFVRPGHEHVPFATLNERFAQNCVACTSASKTFNLAGLQVANIVIPNESLRRAFRNEVIASGYSQPNTLGMVATKTAYEHGGPWLDELKSYLEGNWSLLANTIEQRTPELKLIEAESTYLAWIDCSSLGFDAAGLERFIEDEAGLWLDCGYVFGAGGDQFIRINIATQRSYLERALDQLASAVEKRRTSL
ncbi:MAG: pyridoxal phosphate-dependent aminotransferase, partial [Eggerthellaceae bacterium]|nr:pyridoxal phosphate-dependent aminotransferase [Eggerthellaceae bacterium]